MPDSPRSLPIWPADTAGRSTTAAVLEDADAGDLAYLIITDREPVTDPNGAAEHPDVRDLRTGGSRSILKMLPETSASLSPSAAGSKVVNPFMIESTPGSGER